VDTFFGNVPFILGAFLVLSSTLTTLSCTTVAERNSQPPQTLNLAQTIHFTSPEGGDVIAEPGLYSLEIAAASQLRLVPAEGGEGKSPVLVEAVPALLGESLPTPVALYIPWKDDEHHLIYLLSDGNGQGPGSEPSGQATEGEARKIWRE
jgi:hypothetical protein